MEEEDLQDYWIGRHLDAPQLFFMWEADRAYFAMLWVLAGMLMGSIILGAVGAFVFGRLYARVKEEGGQGLLPRMFYWYSPSMYWLSPYLPSCAREFLGR